MKYPIFAAAAGFALSLPAQAGWQINGPVLNGPMLQGPVLQGPVLQGPILQGPVIQGPVFQGPLLQGAQLNAAPATRIEIRAITLADGRKVVLR